MAAESTSLSTTLEQFLAHTYNFLILGGGTAGLTLAARLTENLDVSVGVIEAGKDKFGDFFIDTPGVCSQLRGNPEYEWILSTVPQVRDCW